MSSISKVRIMSQLLTVVSRMKLARDISLLKVQKRRMTVTTSKMKTSEEPNGDPSEAISPPLFPVDDWIGPVDSKSNLHRIQFAQPKDETRTEKKYRLLKEETLTWNQEFWTIQNEKFVKAKRRFTQDMFSYRGQNMTNEDGTKRVLTPEELAEFYTDFLEQNRETFKVYNREWYKRNISMLLPAACAAIVRLFKGFQKQS
ncbi:COA8 family protein CBG23705, mitochondrial-like isoform X2 [Apostichopus japonicus]|uniref:COA8 family protein CBG23705, mitochondrial-like isoform X2 n=1 Tax=Stichopus japonicus TaxID=307972 RepID=UPI003AB23247